MGRGGTILDRIVAFFSLLILSPFLFLISALIYFVDGPPVFFFQERVGKGGKRFYLCKFRTMVPDAPFRGKPITVGEDPRITFVGKILRKWKIDELPQLWNVLKGEMALVGPRPEVPSFVETYTEEEREILNYLPGITDPASLKYRNESEILTQVEDPIQYYRYTILPDKIRLSLEYQRRRTFFSDISLLFKTVFLLIVPGKKTIQEERTSS